MEHHLTSSSPSYPSRLSLDGDMYYPGCKLHGHGGDLDSDEAAALNPSGHVGLAMDGGGGGGDRSSTCSSPLPPMSASAVPPYDHSNCSEQLHKACACVNFIAEHTKAKEEATKVRSNENTRNPRSRNLVLYRLPINHTKSLMENFQCFKFFLTQLFC